MVLVVVVCTDAWLATTAVPFCRLEALRIENSGYFSGVKWETLSVMGWGSKLQHLAAVTIIRVTCDISDSVTVVLQAPGEGLGSLCWEIRFNQSEPFHIIGQGHLLSHRSGEAFPINATKLARSSILCFTNLSFNFCPHLFFWFCPFRFLH